MTWITPFEAATSAVEMTAPFTFGAAVERDGHFGALHGGGLHAFGQVGRHHLARHDVVGQDGDQLVLVLGLQQVFDGAGRQSGEGSVGRREDGERAFALQRLDQAGSGQRGGQRGEGAGGDGGVDDVLGSLSRRRASRRRWRRSAQGRFCGSLVSLPFDRCAVIGRRYTVQMRHRISRTNRVSCA